MSRLSTTDTDTAARILDAAERLVQTRGFNGFSYADVAAELGVTKASLHYHFPGKAELGEVLIERYTKRFVLALGAIDEDCEDPRAKLEAYADLYASVLRGERMCLCGMLAAEFDTLSEGMRAAVIRFFDANEAWLEEVLVEGRRAGGLRFEGSAREMALSVIGGLEGAMLIARPYRDVGRFGTASNRLLASLTPPAG
jgi:TetR/AcrR family transcriptional regulator, transcriptional repressor for nem operon